MMTNDTCTGSAGVAVGVLGSGESRAASSNSCLTGEKFLRHVAKWSPLLFFSHQESSGWMSKRAVGVFSGGICASGCPLVWRRVCACVCVRLFCVSRAVKNGARKRNLPGSLLLGLV